VQQTTRRELGSRRGWLVAARAVAAALVGSIAVAAAVRAFTITTPPIPAVNAFVRQSQLGMGEGSLNQLANAEIRRDLGRAGMVAKRTIIYSTRIDGDRGTVVAQVAYGQPGGPVVNTTELTILFHRSVWSVGQVTRGAPAQDAN
jgi:hypothetical protein